MSDRDLFSRIKGRLLGMGRVGESWDERMNEDWEEIIIQSEGTFQFIGAAVVGVWEVSLADLGRAARKRLPVDDAGALIERVSDALVPTLDPIQAAGRGLPKAFRAGREQARSSGRLLDAVAPPVHLTRTLGEQVEAGWLKSVEYLVPAFSEIVPNNDLQARLAGGGPALRAVFDPPALTLQASLSELPESMHLGVGVCTPLEDYRYAVSAKLEEALYAQRTVILTVLEQLPTLS